MALLEKPLFAKIEGKLHNRLLMRDEIDAWYRDAAVMNPYDQALSRQPVDAAATGGGHARISDSTALTAIRRNTPPGDVRNAERWCGVIEGVVTRYADTPKGLFIAAYYDGSRREKYKMERVCRKLFIDRSTAYMWRDEIVSKVALAAAMAGLLKNKKS